MSITALRPHALAVAREAREMIMDALLSAEAAADRCRAELARLDAQIALEQDYASQERAEYAAEDRAESAEIRASVEASRPGYRS